METLIKCLDSDNARRLFAALVAASMMSSCTLARDLDSSKQWLVYMETAHAAKMQGRLSEAERLYRAALREAQRSGKQNRLVARSLDSLGVFYCDQQQLSLGEQYISKAVSTAQESLAPADGDLADYLGDLGCCYEAEGKSKEAETSFRQSLAVWSALPAWQHKNDLAVSSAHLAHLLYKAGKLTEAEELYKQAIPDLQGQRLLNDKLLADSKKNYDELRKRRGDAIRRGAPMHASTAEDAFRRSPLHP
jgi:tetratricopeptide (TPR) repeat protein